jgi:ABC-2 type transport system permease protein
MSKTSVFSFRRSWAILGKEFTQLKRDKVTLRMIVMIPIMQLLLFGYALNTDPKHLPAVALIQDHGLAVRSFLAGLENSDYFSIVYEAQSEEEALELVRRGKAQFIINVPENFTRQLVRGERPEILVQADATDPVATSGALGALSGIIDSIEQKDFKGPLAHLKASPPAIDLRLHRMYNPEGFTRYNIVPGLIAIILTMTGIMMTALAITREYERGNMENLLAMPVRPMEVIAGKIVPYVIIGYIQSFIIVAVAKFLFDTPIIGSLWLLSLALLFFITCNMALGFTLSTAAQNQTQALQMSTMVTLPSIMLSGFLFPFHGMPLWARVIGEIIPTTHFIRIVRGILLKGNGPGEIWPDLWPMLLFMVMVTFIAMKRYRRTLD